MNGADCKGTNFFVSRKFFSSFLRTFFHRGGALNSPFPKRVAKVRFFPLPPNLFQDFFDFFSEKAVQIAGRDASRAATEPTRNDATAEKWREESCGRKVAGGKLREESYGRKEATERSEPDSEVAEATEVTIGARPFDVAWLCSGKTFTYYITVTAANFQGLFNLS